MLVRCCDTEVFDGLKLIEAFASLTRFSLVMYRCCRLESNSRFLLTFSPVTSADARPYTSGWPDKWTFSTYTDIYIQVSSWAHLNKRASQ